jgi:hypothetical protein
MNIKQLLLTATTAAVLGTGGISIASAASGDSGSSTSGPTTTAATPAPDSPARCVPQNQNRRHKLRRAARNGAKLAAETIGIDATELRSQLRAGKTIADVARAHSVDPQTVIDALVAAATERIQDATDAGKITAERAAAMTAKLPERIAKFVNEWHPKARKDAAPAGDQTE